MDPAGFSFHVLSPAFQCTGASIGQTHRGAGSTHPTPLSVLSQQRRREEEGWIVGKQAWEQQATTDWLYILLPPPPPMHLDLTGLSGKCFLTKANKKYAVLEYGGA